MDRKIHGTVQSVDGSRLALKADDGRIVSVNMEQVAQNVRRALAPGESVTVTGFYQGNRNTVTARFIQQDSSVGAASPKTGK